MEIYDGYAYIINGYYNPRIWKVDLRTGTRVGAITSGDNNNGGATLAVDGKFLYAFIGSFHSTDHTIMKIDLDTFTTVQTATWNFGTGQGASSIVSDTAVAQEDYLYFGINNFDKILFYKVHTSDISQANATVIDFEFGAGIDGTGVYNVLSDGRDMFVIGESQTEAFFIKYDPVQNSATKFNVDSMMPTAASSFSAVATDGLRLYLATSEYPYPSSTTTLLRVGSFQDVKEQIFINQSGSVSRRHNDDNHNFSGSMILRGLPTTEPTTAGELWISGSSPNHPNSGYLMIYNP